MKKRKAEENSKPDLKHDTMEFSAATSDEDKLDFDDPLYEEEGISIEELNSMKDDPDNIAFALDAEETDHEADADNITNEDEKQIEDWNDGEPEKQEHRRK